MSTFFPSKVHCEWESRKERQVSLNWFAIKCVSQQHFSLSSICEQPS